MSTTTRAAGILYFVTHVASVTALILYAPVLNHPDYVTGSGRDTQILVAGLLEVIVALAVVGTGLALYPWLRQHTPGGALGYAALRAVEGATILAGVVTVLGVVTLRQQYSSTDTAGLAMAGQALVAVHNWTFLIGQGLVVAVDTVVLAYVLYRFRLVPRIIATLGLIGGPLVLASNLGVMFGLYAQESPITAIGAVPVFAWEVCLAVWLIVKRGEAPAAARRPVPAGWSDRTQWTLGES
jgi:hypothetical protein